MVYESVTLDPGDCCCWDDDIWPWRFGSENFSYLQDREKNTLAEALLAEKQGEKKGNVIISTLRKHQDRSIFLQKPPRGAARRRLWVKTFQGSLDEGRLVPKLEHGKVFDPVDVILPDFQTLYKLLQNSIFRSQVIFYSYN
jgi:hypothetical protein